MYGIKGGIEAAVETAAKLDASLNAKKKAEGSENHKAFFKNTDVLKIIQAEYSINHCSQFVRNLLCKGATQEKIREQCEAYVSTKGRYIPEGTKPTPNERSDKAFGLYLFIQGPNKRSVDLAIKMIENIIANGGETRQPPPLMSLSTGAPSAPITSVPLTTSQPNMQSLPPRVIQNVVPLQGPPPTINLIAKVPVMIENPLPGFNLPMKLIGQGGSNLQYIRNETGAVVTLRGIGSAFIEPATGMEAQEVLHFCIEHSKPEALQTARELALNLIATVQQEYAQYQASQATIQSVSVDHNLIVHPPTHIDQQLMQHPVLATSIALPVVQTAAGFIPQPAIAAVPPPHFSQPPPNQLSLPPPGVHIPPQQGPLVPPPVHPPQQIQIQPLGEENAGVVQHQFPAGGVPQQQQQQQYLITPSGQPVQGIITSQGFVVLNQQPQQVFLSQPPAQAPQVIHQGQLAFQSASPAAVTAPVSYHLQVSDYYGVVDRTATSHNGGQEYVQNQPPTVAGSPLQLQQNPQQQHGQVVLHPSAPVQFQNGAVQVAPQQIVGVKPHDGQLQVQPGGQIMQLKHVQVMQPYAPTVQYVSSPGLRPDQAPPVASKESRPGKRKFTEEAEPPPVSQTNQPSPGQQLMQPPPQPLLHQTQYQPPQQNLNVPPQHMGPQPVPHPSQSQGQQQGQQLRQGVGVQDLMTLNQQQREQYMQKPGNEAGGSLPGKSEVDEVKPPLPAGNLPFGHLSPPMDQNIQNPNQWFGLDQDHKHRNQRECDEYLFNRRDRSPRDRPTFNHYSSKPQLYGYQPYPQPSVCPPPPPPPPPLQQPYLYHRR